MCFSILFIKAPDDWNVITNAITALTENCATNVRRIYEIEDLSDNESVVDIVVRQLHGDADYVLEIYWKGMADRSDDAVGIYLAHALNSPVIIADDDPSPYAWLRVSPNGVIEKIDLDIEKLDGESFVGYKIV